MPPIPALYIPAVGGALQTAVTAVLKEINVEEETIQEIVSILDQYALALEGGRPGELSPNVFGASAIGSSLGHHTTLAHQHVFDAMTKMMENLTGTGERVRKFHDDMDFTDVAAAAPHLRRAGVLEA